MHGVGKFCNFWLKLLSILQDRPRLLITLSDLWPRFQGHDIFRSPISQKWFILGTKLLKNSNRKPYPVYRTAPLSMTEWPLTWIASSRHYSTSNISETTLDRAIVTIERHWEVTCALSNGDIFNDSDRPLTRFSRSQHFWKISQKWCILSNGDISNDLDGPLTLFSRSRHFWSHLSKKMVCLRDKVSIEH